MKFSATAAIALVGAAHAAPQVVGGNDLSKFQELDFGAPQDVLVGQHMKAWFQLRIDKFQAPHSAFTEDAWMAYAAKTCLAMDNNMCYSFHTYLRTYTCPALFDGVLSFFVFGNGEKF